MRLPIACLFLLALVQTLAAQNKIPPGTGQPTPDGYYDANWTVTANTVQGETVDCSPVCRPFIVSSPTTGWATQLPGSAWVGPDPTQDSGRGSNCCLGSTTYELVFQVDDPTTYNLTITFRADDSATASLNGASLSPFAVLNGPGPLYSASTVEQVVLSAITSGFGGFMQGTNTLDFVVSNATGGPTGLDVSFIVAPFASSASVTDTAVAYYNSQASAEPVDSATGQYYETESDLRLGGPLSLTFERYYSSQLAGGGSKSALGVNWMSNFDAKAFVSGSNAQVLLIGGQVASFSNSGGSWQLVSPKNIGFQFAPAGANYQLMDPRTKLVYTFSSAGALASIADRNGHSLNVTQGPNGPTLVDDGLGRQLVFTYTGTQLTSVADSTGRAYAYSYSNGLLASVTDPLKNVTNYSYTTAGPLAGLMTKKTLPLGNTPETQTYDAKGRVITQSDPNNNTVSVAYDGNGGTTVTDPFGKVTLHGSDAVGDIAKLTDRLGASASIAYDGSGMRTGVVDRLGNVIKFAPHAPTGYMATQTDAMGNTTAYTYTAQTQGSFTFYNLTAVSYPDGTSTSITYDPNGNMLSMTRPDGSKENWAYDSGSLVKDTAPNNQATVYTWNSDGTMATLTDPLGNVTTLAYDTLKRLTKVTDPNGGAASYVYDSDDQVLLSEDPSGSRIQLDFDANGQPDAWISPAGNAFRYAYTGTGKVASVEDPLDHFVRYTYDASDQMVKTQDAAGDTVSLTRAASGRVTSLSDNSGTRFTYDYDAEGHLVARTDATERKTSFTYDPLGRVTNVTTPGGSHFSTTYNMRGFVTGRTDALGATEAMARDGVGRVTGITAPGALTTQIQRNDLGLPVALTTPNGNIWTFGYDADGRRTKRTDPLGNANSVTYSGHQITGLTFPLGTAAITNDANGLPTKIQLSDGTTINKTYDALGSLSSADGVTIQRDAMEQLSNINGIAITRDAANRPLTLTYAAGKVVTYAYDNVGRLASITDWVGGKTVVAYDAASRPTALTYPNGVATNYAYDADGRLIGIAAGTLGSISLTRDAVGKITSAVRNLPIAPVLNPGLDEFTYDAASQVVGATYDRMGRATSQNARSYTWNLASQLTGYTDGVNTAAFTYDGLNEISSSTLSGAAQTFVFNYLFPYPALSIVRLGGVDLRYYVYLPSGTLLYSIEASGNARRFYHFDEAGNTAFLTDDGGALTDSYAITPFGEIADHMGTSDNPFTWQGQYGVIQEGQGLYYLRARHYDSSAARFLSRDPSMSLDPRAIEPYAYAKGNPLLFHDPRGTDSVEFDYNLWLFGQLDNLSNTAACQLSPDWCEAIVWEYQQFIINNGDLNYGSYQDIFDLIADPHGVGYVVNPGGGTQIANGVEAGSGLLSSTAGTIVLINGNTVVSNDGGSLIAQDGSSLIAQDGSSLIAQDGSSLIAQDGSSLIAQDGSSLRKKPGWIVPSGTHPGRRK